MKQYDLNPTHPVIQIGATSRLELIETGVGHHITNLVEELTSTLLPLIRCTDSVILNYTFVAGGSDGAAAGGGVCRSCRRSTKPTQSGISSASNCLTPMNESRKPGSVEILRG